MRTGCSCNAKLDGSRAPRSWSRKSFRPIAKMEETRAADRRRKRPCSSRIRPQTIAIVRARVWRPMRQIRGAVMPGVTFTSNCACDSRTGRSCAGPDRHGPPFDPPTRRGFGCASWRAMEAMLEGLKPFSIGARGPGLVKSPSRFDGSGVCRVPLRVTPDYLDRQDGRAIIPLCHSENPCVRMDQAVMVPL